MNEHDSQALTTLGGRVRHLRTSRGVTLDFLAECTGFSKGYLSRIENNKKTPPLGTLARIADALDTSLPQLLTPGALSTQNNSPFLSLVRGDARSEVVRGASAFGYDYVSLSDAGAEHHMLPMLFTFPAEIDKHVFFEHKGEEFMYILSGKVEWRVGHETYTLEPGDSLYFDARLPHRGHSIGGEATALVVLYTPEQESFE